MKLPYIVRWAIAWITKLPKGTVTDAIEAAGPVVRELETSTASNAEKFDQAYSVIFPFLPEKYQKAAKKAEEVAELLIRIILAILRISEAFKK